MKAKRCLGVLLALCLLIGMVPPTGVYATPEHVHTEQCYRLICKEPEGHTHTEACYETGSEPVCGLEAHTHGEECSTEGTLTCMLPEHTHTETCYRRLICGREEATGHTHGTECYELICTQAGAEDAPVPSEGTEAPEESDAVDEVDLSVLPQREEPLTNILETDEQGNPKMYTTLYDAKHRVVSTNDPAVAQDPVYAAGETVDRGSPLYVQFRMAEIMPQDGEAGIQEQVTYYMEQLPQELIPAETDASGRQLLNPDTPTGFFTLSGQIQAYGGIYGTPGQYRLKLFFAGVENQIDISGTFQYGATVSQDLEPGATYTITYVPGGSVSFTVSPEQPDQPAAAYGLGLSGGSGGPTAFYWQASITRQTPQTASPEEPEEEPQDVIFPYRDLTITTDSAMGVWINQNNQTIFTGYGDNYGPMLSMGVTYTTQDENGSNLRAFLTAAPENATEQGDGTTVIRLTDPQGPLEAELTFRREDAVRDTVSSSGGKYAYITNTVHVSLSDGAGNLAKNIQSLVLYVPTISYDDYMQFGSVGYPGTATLSGVEDSELAPDLQAVGSISVSYNGMGSPYVSSSSYAPDNRYAYLSDRVYTSLNSGSSSYRGNYYWVEFAPSISNTAGVNYYISNRSFLPGNALTSSDGNGRGATFTTQNAGTKLEGMVGSSVWEFLGTVSVAQVIGDSNLIANSCFASGGSTGDAKLQYQLKQVFSGGSGDLLVYRSVTPHTYGEYMYLIVDPGTYETAQKSSRQGWYEYLEGGDSAKPASWKIHVFNAPCSTFYGSMFQNIGAFTANDSPSSGGTITDRITTGIGGSTSTGSHTSSYSVSKYQASLLDARWVGDDMIFWEMTFDASNWPSWSQGYLYTGMEGGLQMKTGGSATVDGQALNCNQLYVKSPGGGWTVLNTPYASNNGWPSNGSIDKLTGEGALWSMGYPQNWCHRYEGNMTQYRNAGGDITLGFFTRVTGRQSSGNEYKCSGELIVQTGDISRYAAYGSSNIPTSAAGNKTQYPIRISATGYAPVPQIYKSGETASTGDGSNTVADWTVQVVIPTSRAGHTSSPILSEYYGGYNGIMRMGDGMAEAKAVDAAGNQVEGVNPGTYTYITKMLPNGISISEYGTGGGCGPIPYAKGEGYYGDTSWEKYVDGAWKPTGIGILWEPKEPGIYRRILTSSGLNSEANPLAAYVYYAGNMAASVRDALGSQLGALGVSLEGDTLEQALVVEYRGLAHAQSSGGQSITPIRYTTELDHEALCAAADAASGKTEAQKLASYYDVSLTNGASMGVWQVNGTAPATATVRRRVSAQLSIEKTVKGVDQTEGYTGSYELKITNGFSQTDRITVEDYITGFDNIYQTLGSDGSTTPIPGGAYNTEGTGAEVRALVRHMMVRNVVIRMTVPGASGSTVVYQNGAFTPQWSSSSFTDANSGNFSEKPGALFLVKLQPDGETKIPAGAEFTVSYETQLNMDTPLPGETQSFRESDYYLGGGLLIRNGAVASRTYDRVTDGQTGRTRAGLPTGNRDGNLLTVDCGGSVSCVYLRKDQLTKKNSSSGNGGDQWLICAETGTIGKTGVTLSLTDTLGYGFTKLSFVDAATGKTVTLRSLPDPQKQQITTLLEHIVERHTTYRNIKIYDLDAKPANRSALGGVAPLWDLRDLTVTGGTQVLGGTAALQGISGLQLGQTPEGTRVTWEGDSAHPALTLRLTTIPATLGQKADGTLDHGHSGFRVEAEGLGFRRYLVASYDTETDWDAVVEEAQRVLGNYSMSGSLQNQVTDGAGDSKSSIGNSVSVEEITLSKAVTSVGTHNGTASWRISTNTGTNPQPKLEIQDSVAVTLPEGTEERVRRAAEAATYVDPDSVTITLGGRTIYQNRTHQNGWNEDNLSVQVDGRTLQVTVENTEENTVLEKNQTYRISYDTGFDLEGFYKEGGRYGDRYTLVNTADLEYGQLKLTQSTTADLQPQAPISLSKSVEAVEGNRATWVASASTGSVARTDFTLWDQVTSKDSAVEGAVSLENLEILITDSQGNTKTYSADRLPENGVLTAPDGGAFMLDTTGIPGFLLTLAQVPAHTTIQVRYTTRVDRDTYLMQGGKEGSVALMNDFRAGGQDGNGGGISRQAAVTVKKPFAKQGLRAGETSQAGNPLLNWNIQVELTQKFTAGELKHMEEVTITDQLNPVLKLLPDSVTVTDGTGTPVLFTAEMHNRRLSVVVRDPAAHPNFTVSLTTECLAGIDGLTNSAELFLDGKKTEEAVTPKMEKLQVDGQYGTIGSAEIPTFTPEAWKYVDNALCREDGAYQFQLTAVDAQGAPLTGTAAYTEIRSNDGEGKITYSTIGYRKAGTYYYEIKELGDDILDHRVFMIQVDVVKTLDGYLVEHMILSPQQYEAVRFDNTLKPKTTSFTVKKVWKDQNDKAGIRPNEIIVWLYQDDQPYHDTWVTLSQENGWTYTWEDLPVAGGDYSAREQEVLGYGGTSVTENGTTVITNTVQLGNLRLAKTVTGQAGEQDREFHFTVTLTDALGVPLEGRFPYTGSREGSISSGGEITLKHGESVTLENLPAGTQYLVEEREADQEGYVTTAQGASGEIRDGETAQAQFTNSRDQAPDEPTPGPAVSPGPSQPPAPSPSPSVSPSPSPSPSPSASQTPAPNVSPSPSVSAKPDTTPDTGDPQHMWLWLLLLLGSAGGMIGAAVYKKKKE